jgi:hypothetical protein
MKISPKFVTTQIIPSWRGFTLVVTLSLLLLLAIVAVGLLSLSSISLRNGVREHARRQAQANARLALAIAIGQLQKQLGPDQRISANGSIVSRNPVRHPHFTGAWDSWFAGPIASASVNANYPHAESHHQTIGSQSMNTMRPEYTRKNDHFRGWLASLSPAESADPQTPVTLALDGKPSPTTQDTAIHLVGRGSLGEQAMPTDFVSARLMEVASSPNGEANLRGRYAWWVGDESQKARVMYDSYLGDDLVSSDKIFRSQAPASTGTNTIAGLRNLTHEQQVKLGILPSLNTLDVVPGVQSPGAATVVKFQVAE